MVAIRRHPFEYDINHLLWIGSNAVRLILNNNHFIQMLIQEVLDLVACVSAGYRRYEMNEIEVCMYLYMYRYASVDNQSHNSSAICIFTVYKLHEYYYMYK